MKYAFAAVAAFGLLTVSSPMVFAQDASAFQQCQSCHTVQAPDGNVIAGRGRTGPNLYGVIGRVAGTTDGASPDLARAGAAGLVWSEATVTQYVSDPSAFISEFLGDPAARVRMTYRARDGQAQVARFLASAR